MALSLLGKQAIKEQPKDDVDDVDQIEIVFRIVGDDGSEIDRVHYSTPKLKEVTE